METSSFNIVVIVSDTLRQDHLGCYGNSWIQTPQLDRLAKKSLVFDRAYAASFPTMPARVDLLTGRYSFAYLGWGPLPHDELTLPLVLGKNGDYLTMGIVDTPFYLRNGYGFDRGFSDFQWIRGQRRGAERLNVTHAWRYEEDYFAPATFLAAEKWLERHYRDRFFLLLDTFDPHEPWDPPGYYVEKYYKNYDGTPSPWPSYWYWQETGLSEEELKRGHAHYCAEVTMVDRCVGRFIERLESLGLLDNTVVIFTSDHGFYFGEHGIFGKAMMRSADGGYVVGPSQAGDITQNEMKMLFRSPETGKIAPGAAQWWRSPLYEEDIRLPLIMYLPNAKPRRIAAMVTTPDLMPTIVELAGLEVPGTVKSRSLLPLIKKEASSVHDFIISSWPLYNPGQSFRQGDDWAGIVTEPLPATISDGEWTLLYAMEGEPVELYHIASDANQEKNVLIGNEDIARGLHKKFVGFLEKNGTDEVLLKPRRKLS